MYFANTINGIIQFDSIYEIETNELIFDENIPSITSNLCEEYFIKNNQLNRESGPALIINNEKYYYLNGKLFPNLEYFLKCHPNQDKTFQAIMRLKYV
jgi:hypothetical protein